MSTTRQKVEVIVIGAGIAGLAAARDLSIDGYDVLVLEARNRIGGRIWTSRDLGVPADLGASWIHGFEDNTISRLAKRHGIEILRTDISSVSPARYRSVALYDEDGRRLSTQETVEISEMMADYLDFIALKQTEGREMSLLAVEEEFAVTQNFNPGQRRWLNFIARTYLEHEWAGPRSEVSLLEHDKALNFAGHDRVFPQGYSQLTDKLASDSRILLGHEVKQIDYSGALVDVLTNHGSYHAHHVLVTVPLGVLQAGRIAFNPSLPASKREAIREARETERASRGKKVGVQTQTLSCAGVSVSAAVDSKDAGAILKTPNANQIRDLYVEELREGSLAQVSEIGVPERRRPEGVVDGPIDYR